MFAFLYQCFVILALLSAGTLMGYALMPKSQVSAKSLVVGCFASAYFVLVSKGLGLSAFATAVLLLTILGIGTAFAIKNHKYIQMVGFGWSTNNPLTSKLTLMLCGLILCLTISHAITDVIRNPVEAGDALAYWLAKAKAISVWADFKSFPTVNYPTLGSIIWSFSLVMSDGEHLGRIFFILLFSFIFFDFFLVCKKNFPTKENSFWALALISTLMFAFALQERFAGTFWIYHSGYMDWLMSSLIVASYFCLIAETLASNREKVNLSIKHHWHRFFLLGCAGLVKEEGIFFGLIYLMVFCVIYVSQYGRRNINTWVTLIQCIFLTITVACTYKATLLFNGYAPENAQGFSIDTFYQNLARIGDVGVLELIIHRFVGQLWSDGLAFGLLVIAFAIAIRLGRRLYTVVVFTPIFLSQTFIFLIFLTTPLPLSWHLSTALERLMFMQVLACYFGIVLLFFSILSSPHIDHKQD